MFQSVAPAILWLTLGNGQVLGVTPGHEVWTHQAGWTHAAALRPGDTFAGPDDCPVAVVAIAVDPTPTPVYNLEVDGRWTYFAAGAWVHNNSCTAIFHHLLPRHFEVFFRRAGPDIDEFVLPIEGDFHKRLHGKGGTLIDSWNGRWKQFFDVNPQATKQQIMLFYGELFRSFFLD